MGQFILVDPAEVAPSQDFLKEKTLGHILRCYAHRQEADLPPPPMVRIDPKTLRYVAIDGHNLLAIDELLKTKTKVFVADSPDDGLTALQEGVEQRNRDLKEKFDQSLVEAENLERTNMRTMSDLRRKYPYLSDKEVAHKHFGI